MDSLMDNCSFLKKDIEAATHTGHLYTFKYLLKKSGGAIKTDKVVTRGADKDEAERVARDILHKEWGEKADIVLTKWIQLES